MTSDTPSQAARVGWQPWSTVPRDDMDVLARRDDFYQVVFWDTAENTGWHVGDADLRYPDGAFTHWRRDCLSISPPAEALPAGVEALRKIAEEARKANAVIRLNRDGSGQGRVKVATAMHRIAKWAEAALTSAPAPEDRTDA